METLQDIKVNKMKEIAKFVGHPLSGNIVKISDNKYIKFDIWNNPNSITLELYINNQLSASCTVSGTNYKEQINHTIMKLI